MQAVEAPPPTKHVVVPVHGAFTQLCGPCRLSKLPQTTKHVVCLFTVPLVWPKLPLSEGVMTVVDGLPILKGVMTKTGIGAGIVDK